MTVAVLDFSRQNERRINRRLVLSEIILNGPISRTEIAARIELTPASVSRISRELIDADLVVEGGECPGNSHRPPGRSSGRPPGRRPGRRCVSLDMKSTGGFVLGISMNVFQQHVTLADLNNRTVARRELRLNSFEHAGQIVDSVAIAAEDLIKGSGIPRNRLFGGSFAISGAVGPDIGTIHSAPLFGWKNVKIGKMLSDRLHIPIHVENLPDAMNLAETCLGIARNYSNVVLLNASLGIGVSIIMDKRLIRKGSSSTGLMGDLSLWKDAKGQPLSVDNVAGGWGVLRTIEKDTSLLTHKEAVPKTQKLFEIIESARYGDLPAITALKSAGRALGKVIQVIHGILHPELIIIAGPLAGCPSYFEAAREFFDEGTTGNPHRPNLKRSDMTRRAAACWLAINEFLLQRDLDLDGLGRRTVA